MTTLQYLRVWPEWESTGIWALDQPLQRTAGKCVGYDQLPISQELVARFTAWQDEFSDWAPENDRPDGFWDRHYQEMQDLAQALKHELGPHQHVEYCIGYTPTVV